MKKIAIFGGGGFGREVHMLIEQINYENNVWNFIGYFDDGIPRGEIVNNFPILGGVEDVNDYEEDLNLVFAIGNPLTKKNIIERINKSNIIYPVLIHPNVQLSNKNYHKIGVGSIITANCVISVNTNIGKHVLVNLGCTIGHDVEIGDYTSIMPACNISGEVIINECVYIGVGAKIRNQIKIGEKAVVGMGSVVLQNVASEITVAGNPARRLK
ncbi:MAG: NeuD/PglB/VioB family sugar acetyltransferase [Ignavibacteriae bacterium]|nr:NeuD/PglB/VioB family sugar acetyltransferase [Ignavibacteriota bacterium]